MNKSNGNSERLLDLIYDMVQGGVSMLRGLDVEQCRLISDEIYQIRKEQLEEDMRPVPKYMSGIEVADMMAKGENYGIDYLDNVQISGDGVYEFEFKFPNHDASSPDLHRRWTIVFLYDSIITVNGDELIGHLKRKSSQYLESCK